MGSARARRTAADTAAFLAVAALAVVALFPFYWMLRTAFTPQADAYSLHPTVWPGAVTWINFVRVVTSPNIPFVQYFKNSLIVSAATTLLVILAGSWGAYALARMDFRGKNTFGITLLIIQMFPPV
ncbi:MAG TPA: carbohydrate ABC transporter permease, partial [bacterium]|nr:carbohydrate ABC transporter permease [bacterium]